MNESKPSEETLFEAVSQLPAEKRGAYLTDACGADVSLRERLDVLLRAHDRASSFMAEPVAPAVPRNADLPIPLSERLGDHIGHYKLLQQLGEGGCGVVYVAEQETPVRRKVALKIIKLGMDTKNVIARFEAERQALAMMDHPNIAKVLDAGATETGRPFFVMELVRGVKITDYCDQNQLSTRERIDLAIKVCQAIQHAHQKGVIHRDIKPSNILVTLHDGVPVPKVIDFGIAKATEGRLADATVFTQLHLFIGTPAYMSPEQAEMSGLDIDTRSDIYSLGVLLYELLAGRTPFAAEDLMAAGIDAMRKTIREKEPIRPSTRLVALNGEELTTTAKHRSAASSKLVNQLKGDLDWIVMKCLEKDRARRYETANGLATDLKRHLDNEPVVARPPGNLYRFQKLVRRNKLAFTAGCAIAATLIIGLIVSTWSLSKVQQALRRAVAAEKTQAALREEADAARRQAQRALAAADFSEANRLIEANDAQDAVPYLSRILSTDPGNSKALMRLATLISYHSWVTPAFTLKHSREVSSAQFSPDGKRVVTASGDCTAHVWDAQSGHSLIRPLKHGDKVNSAQFSPDGRYVVTASSDHTAQVWDAQTGQPLAEPLKHGDQVNWAEFSPDGRYVVTASADHTAQVWDAQTGQPRAGPLKHGDRVNWAEFSPDGQRVVTASSDNTARLWDARTGQPLTEPMQHADLVSSAHFDPTGARVVTAARDYTARVWNAQNGQPLTEPLKHGDMVYSAQFSPDGKSLATASRDNMVRLWDSHTGKLLTEPLKHGNWVMSAQFSPDGKSLVTASTDHTARLWDAQTGKPLTEPLEHGNGVQTARFSADGKRIVTASWDNTARVWDIQGADPLAQRLNHLGDVITAQFSPDGRRVVTASADHTAQVWDAQTGQPLAEPLKHGDRVNWAEFSPDGQRVVTASSDNTARVWDARTGQALIEPLKHLGPVWSAHFNSDGKHIVTASSDHSARVWDTRSGQPRTSPLKHDGTVRSAQFSPDGERVVTASEDQTARVWNARNSQPLTGPLQHGDIVESAQFSPDGKSVVTASRDNAVRLWDSQTGQLLTEPMKHENWVSSAQFSPDGKSLVTASADCTARLWDAHTGKALTEPMKHGNRLSSAQFSADSKRIVTAAWDNTSRVWDAQTGQPLTEPFKHKGPVAFAQFSQDNKHIITVSGPTAWVWDVGFAPSRCPDWLLQLAEALSVNRLNQQGILEPNSLDRAQTIARIRQHLKEQPDDGDGVLWGRWLLADRSTRSISPFSSISVPAYIESRINESTTESLDEAERLSAGNAELLSRVVQARKTRTETRNR